MEKRLFTFTLRGHIQSDRDEDENDMCQRIQELLEGLGFTVKEMNEEDITEFEISSVDVYLENEEGEI